MYNTNQPLNRLEKDVTPIHKLSIVIYIYNCAYESDYIGRISQRFHVRRNLHVIMKHKHITFSLIPED